MANPVSIPAPERTYTGSLTYRASAGWKAFFLLFSGLGVVLGGLGTWHFLTTHQAANPAGDLALAGVSFAFFLLGLYLGLWITRFAIVLQPEAIEIHDVTRIRIFHRHELAGWRTITQSSPPSLILERKEGGRVRISQIFRLDDNFSQWLSALPNLDAQERVRSQQEIESDLELGATREDRVARLARAKRWAGVLTAVSFGVGAWGWFYPEPYRVIVVLLAILPWLSLAVAAAFKGMIRIDQKRNDARPAVALAIIIPGCVLALRAITDLNVLAWQRALWLSLGLSLVLTVASALIDSTLRARLWMVVLMLALNLGYGYGSVMQANALLDRAPVTVYSAVVNRKYVTHGKHTDYKLVLGPWGPKQNDEVSVSRRFYDSLEPGDNVCLYVRPGALRIGWYVVHSCR